MARPSQPRTCAPAPLRKAFPSFEQDLAREAQALRERSCLPPDTPIPGTERRAFKRRVRASDANEGKRGGFRFIYAAFPEGIAFLRLYHKRETPDIPLRDLLRALLTVQEQLGASVEATKSKGLPSTTTKS